MMTIKPVYSLLLLLLAPALLFAQENGGVDMADALRQDGKIYVVVAVLCIVFAGITLYLVRIDRRISRLEKERKSGH
jgi:CcmD family protein